MSLSERDTRGPEDMTHAPSVRDYADTSPRMAWGGECNAYSAAAFFFSAGSSIITVMSAAM